MNRLKLLCAALAASLTLPSCIENDLPYPVVVCAIESIAAEGSRAIRRSTPRRAA